MWVSSIDSPGVWGREQHPQILNYLERAKIIAVPTSGKNETIRRYRARLDIAPGFTKPGTNTNGRNTLSHIASVTLIGAGPGDPGLLTLAGRDALESAEVVLYDRLVGDGILAMMPATA